MTNETLHTAATAVSFGVGVLCELAGVALACFPMLGGNPDPALVAGSAFLAASGLIQWQKLLVTPAGSVAAVSETATPAATGV